MRLKGIGTKIKICFYLIFLIGLGCFFVLPVFSPIRSEIVLIGKNISRGCQNLKEATLEKTNWRLNKVDVLGTVHTKRKDWVQAVNLSKNQSMVQVDLDLIRENLMKLPWMKEVVVERYLPDTLRIYVTEKTPIALWQNQGQYRPLDELAHPINDAGFSSNELILVVGSDAPEHTLELLRALNQVPDLSRQIKSAVRIEGRRWNLYTNNEIKILLPQSDLGQALLRLNHQNEKQDILKKDVANIDMRVKGKIKLTLHPQKKGMSKKGKK